MHNNQKLLNMVGAFSYMQIHAIILNELVRLTSGKGGDPDMEAFISVINQLASFFWQVDLILVSILIHKYFN